MVTSGVGAAQEGDTWIRFQKLAEEARMRNSGLARVREKNAIAASNAFPGFPVAPSRRSNRAALFSGTPDVRKKILGGQFDAYA